MTWRATSDSFARSSEFRRTYGALDDRRFVELVYRNVLGREGDAAGEAYWTRQLTTGRRTRGAVMVQFSESNEFRRLAAPIVEPLAVTYLMLDRRPTTAERTRWVDVADAYATIPADVLGSAEYAARLGA